ncbi:hypothetical protein [Natrinema salifodinae]|uniref:Uncharacterized protein n=1 Tax=Natrinema salifodinae TaxID=1202768 RepID=A0A1I0N6D6_9EURY|nr:hypothetical protein [Natrinema salifodinae]SEV96401.1 hypothetical protein SAMN05216285_1363 [Natrinema salifodinae]
MELESTPESLTCTECGEELSDQGYLPAVERDDDYEPLPDGAICGACGFNEVGFAGCAPELDDVVGSDSDLASDADQADALLHVRITEDGLDVLSAKE